MVVFKPTPDQLDSWDEEVANTYLAVLYGAIDQLENEINQDDSLDLFEIESFMSDLAKKSMPDDFKLTMEKMREMGDLCRLVDFLGKPTTKEEAYAVAGDLVLEYIYTRSLSIREARQEIQNELNQFCVI
jgi:hypothetical protein